VDLTRNFFFSYTYRLTHTLQHNHTAAAPAAPRPGACPTRDTAAGGGGESGSSSGTGSSTGSGGAAGGNGMAGEDPPGLAVFEGSMFAWNAHLTRPLRTAAGSARWTVPLVHGFWEQRQVGGRLMRACANAPVLLRCRTASGHSGDHRCAASCVASGDQL
jgi:hypothetical protein